MQERKPPRRTPGPNSADERKWFEQMTVPQLLVLKRTVRDRITKDTRTLAALNAVLHEKQPGK